MAHNNMIIVKSNSTKSHLKSTLIRFF